jgi:rare lipoprotein A
MKQRLSQLIIIALVANGAINMAHATMSGAHKYSHHRTIHNQLHSKKHTHHDYMVGTASFYGENDGFQGRPMADGRRFNTNEVYSAAHPTLPLGTKLMVTNLSNGRTIYVEVRDRMPRQGRVIDLTAAAAKYLGMHRRGLTRVELVRVSNKEFEENKRYLQVEDGDSGAQG